MKQPDPGHRAQTRPIHHGRVFDLVTDTITFPDGTIGELEVIRHPGAAAVLPFLSDPAGADPTILLIRQYRHAAGGWLLEIPAGRLESGETPVTCAGRELLEETGCVATRLELLTAILTTPGFTDERIHLFMATGLAQGQSRPEPDEFIEAVPMPLTTALEKIAAGEIVDGKTIIALLFASGFRLNR